jgi:hypothetical protein
MHLVVNTGIFHLFTNVITKFWGLKIREYFSTGADYLSNANNFSFECLII